MAEIPDRVPGEIIFATYANDIKQRSVQRYTDNTQRDALNPLPENGALAYITTTDQLQIFNGSFWDVFYVPITGAAMTGALFTVIPQSEGLAQFRNIHILDAPPASGLGVDGDVAFVFDGSP